MRASLGLLLLAGALSAQAVPRVPLRPGVDTNDARSYYGEGLSSLRDDPVRADRAFYWATRIDPALAEAWYGRWVAKVLSLPALSLVNYVGGTRVWAHDSALHVVDSLKIRAEALNPLIHEGLDVLILQRAVKNLGGEDLDQYVFGNPGLAGWLYYTRGDYTRSIDSYAHAIRMFPKDAYLHWQRGRAFLLRLRYDSALAEMRLYRGSLTKEHEKSRGMFWASNEETDLAIGRAAELSGDLATARQEYDTALIENLGYAPAHVALARLAVARGDTTEALREYDLGTQVPDAPTCYAYGVLLWASRRPADAVTHFQRAIAADSDFAPPYLPLAYIEEGSGDDSLATLHYSLFILKASSTLTQQLATARQHLDALEAKKRR